MNQVCLINNSVCFNPYVFYGLLILLFLVFFGTDKFIKREVKQEIVKIQESPKNTKQDSYYKRIFDVLSPPERDYMPQYPNEHQSGDALPSFQQVGVAFRDESDPNYDPQGQNRFSIYGRPRFYGAREFEYYVINENGIKCSLGDRMKELFEGDTITIPSYTGAFNVIIYQTQDARYNPWDV